MAGSRKQGAPNNLARTGFIPKQRTGKDNEDGNTRTSNLQAASGEKPGLSIVFASSSDSRRYRPRVLQVAAVCRVIVDQAP